MNELDWPMEHDLTFRIGQRLSVALATIEALDESHHKWPEARSTLGRALQIVHSIHSAVCSQATPAQMSGMFGDLTDILPTTLDLWGNASNTLYRDPAEWEVEADRRRTLRIDFHTLRARLYPDGQFGSG